MQKAQQKKPSFIPPAPAPKDAADQGFAPPRCLVQQHAKKPSASGKVTRAYSSYDRDLI